MNSEDSDGSVESGAETKGVTFAGTDNTSGDVISKIPNWGTLIEEVQLERSTEFVDQYLAEKSDFRRKKESEHEAQLVRALHISGTFSDTGYIYIVQ
jgi:hypothetical protein